MMPVMIWGILILGKRYGLKDFGLAILITAGCTLFLLTGEVKSKVSSSMFDSSVWGLALMLGATGFIARAGGYSHLVPSLDVGPY